MLLPRQLPEHFVRWNREWGAPSGHSTLSSLFAQRILQRLHLNSTTVAHRMAGPFSLQGNNDTRRVEYPWAYYATPLRPGMVVVEIGGALSGFQFVLSKEGCRVTNVDPGEAQQQYWDLALRLNGDTMSRLNRVFRTDVQLCASTLQDAELPDESVDRVFSISTIEHIPSTELEGLAREIGRILRPGGHCVLTIDLFIDLAPFTPKLENYFGQNANVSALVDATGLEMVEGTRAQLNGFEEFDAVSVLEHLGEHFVGSGHPVCAQALVLRKP